MARTLQYGIRRESWLGCENQPMSQYIVTEGDNPRDYVFADFRPMRRIAAFHTRNEAESFIAQQQES